MNSPTQPLIPQTPIKATFEIQEPYVQNPTGIASSRLPMTAYCIFCKKNIETEVTYHTGRSTHFMGGLTCLLGFYCCCCCLPYHLHRLRQQNALLFHSHPS